MKWKNSSMTCVVLVGLLLAGCNDSGGGSSTVSESGAGETETEEQSAGVVASAVMNVIGSVNSGLGVTGSSLSRSSLQLSKTSGAKSLKTMADGSYSSSSIEQAKSIVSLTDLESLCDRGGTAHLDFTADGFAVTYSGCKEGVDTNGDGLQDQEVFTDGYISFDETVSGFDFSHQNLTRQVSSLSSGILLDENFNDFTITGDYESTTLCGESDVADVFTVQVDGIFSKKLDVTGDGILDEDRSKVLTGFTFTATVNQFNAVNCEPTDFLVSQYGSLEEIDNMDASNSFTMNISSDNPLSIASQVAADGKNVTLNGSFSIESSCFTRTFSIENTTPLFYPYLEKSAIPVSGVITVPMQDSIENTISYTAGGIEIDYDNDNQPDVTYENIDDIEVCG
jgi:hypothetical protein